MRRIFLFVLAFALSVSCFSSCQFNLGADPGSGGDAKPENFILGDGEELNFVYSQDIHYSFISMIESELYSHNVVVRAVPPTSEVGAHELVIGKLDRPISKTAYDRLDRMTKNNKGDLGFLIYSDGTSLAIAFDEDTDNIALAKAVDHLIDEILSDEVALAQGVVFEQTVNVYDYYGELDDRRDAEVWAKLSASYDPDVVDAVRSYMSIYDGEKLMKWLINLFDPGICVCKDLYGLNECQKETDPENAPEYCKLCGTGGFYFSNSARDTVGFLPDVESTLQALGLLAALGMGSDYATLLPEWMGDKIAEFTVNLQDPDGFFYHPQWGKAIAVSRRSRDLNWSKNILEKYGVKSKYPLADSGAVATSSGLTVRLGGSSVAAVSKLVMAEGEAFIPDHLKTLEAFKDYLENTLDFYNKAYPAGNELGSQSSQIAARGQEYVDAMFEHMDKAQNENGTWHSTPGYYAINGLMKISGIYKNFGREIKNADKAALACFDAIMSEDNPGGIVDVWNAWVAISYVLENVKLFAENGAEKEAEIRALVIKNSAGAITATRDKVVKFSRDDGSYSYVQTGNCTHSQSAPVAVPGHSEGDVNGCMIATTQMIGFMFSVLNMNSYKPQLCGQREKAIMLDMIDELSPVNKLSGAVDMSGEPLDFDYDDIGETPEYDGISSVIGNGANGSTVKVTDDPRGNGNVLSFNTEPQSYDKVNFMHMGTSTRASCIVFTAEMCFRSATVTNDFIRIEMGENIDSTGAYRLSFRPMTDGSIGIYDNSSAYVDNCMVNYLGESVDIGEWFKLRIEYYPGEATAETVRAKVYFNDKLLSISDNYFDYYGKKFTDSGSPMKTPSLTRIQALTSTDAEILLDNVHAYYSKDVYAYEELHEDYRSDPYSVNVDKVAQSAPVYDFNNGSYPEEFTVNKGDGAADLIDLAEGKALSLSGGASVNIPATRTAAFANYASVSFDLIAASTATATVGSVELHQFGKSDGLLNRFTFKVDTLDANKVLTVSEAAKGSTIRNFNIPFGDGKVNLKIEYYYKDSIILFYLDGELLGMSSEFTPISKRQVFNDLLITGNDGMTVDNVTVEHGNKDYMSTMEPQEPGFTHSFDNGLGDIEVSGTGAGVKDYALEVPCTGNSTVTVPANLRDLVMNVNVIEFEMELTGNTKIGSHILSIVDENGDKIISFAIGQKSGVGYVYENTALGTHPTAIVEFDATKKVEFTLEFYEIERICKIFINGKYAAGSALVYSAENASLTPTDLTIDSTSACQGYRLDNVVFDRLRKGYIKETVANKEDKSPEITFGYSAGNDYPSNVKAEIKSSAPIPVIVETMRDGSLDKVLKFDTRSGGGDELIVTQTEQMSGASSYVFKADILFEKGSEGSYQLYIGSANGSILAIYYFGVNNGNVTYYYRYDVDGARVMSDVYVLGKAGEWIEFSFVFFNRGANSIPHIKTYADGSLVADHIGVEYPRADQMHKPGKVTFYGTSSGNGTMYVDDISFKGSDEKYE